MRLGPQCRTSRWEKYDNQRSPLKIWLNYNISTEVLGTVTFLKLNRMDTLIIWLKRNVSLLNHVRMAEWSKAPDSRKLPC